MTNNLNPALARKHDEAQLKHRENTPTWVLLCDSGAYKLFANYGSDDGLHELDSDNHEVPKITNLVSNERGRNKASEGAVAHHAYAASTDPRKKVKNNFISEVAEKINAWEKDFTRLIIAAPPSALHGLREALSADVRAKIIGELNKDLMQENASTLPHFIKTLMDLKNPEDYIQTGPSQSGEA